MLSNAAAHLEPGGAFVLEVNVPALRRLPAGDHVRVARYGEAGFTLDEYDIANQGLVSRHFRAVGGTLEERAIPFRLVWPSELDLMAQLAGFRLRERWGDWTVSRSRARARSTYRSTSCPFPERRLRSRQFGSEPVRS